MQVTPSLSALHNTRTDGEMNVVFTRLKIALPQEEEFEIRRFPFSYWGHSQGINNGCWRVAQLVSLSISLELTLAVFALLQNLSH